MQHKRDFFFDFLILGYLEYQKKLIPYQNPN